MENLRKKSIANFFYKFADFVFIASVVEAVAWFIVALAALQEDYYWMLVFSIAWPAMNLIPYFVIRAFAQIVDDLHYLRTRAESQKPAAAERAATAVFYDAELPEL